MVDTPPIMRRIVSWSDPSPFRPSSPQLLVDGKTPDQIKKRMAAGAEDGDDD